MLCPSCQSPQSTLAVTERHGVEIDTCPRCRGVWLDRGELDKILEREAMYDTRDSPRGARDRSGRDYDNDDRRPGGRRRSLWTELFD